MGPLKVFYNGVSRWGQRGGEQVVRRKMKVCFSMAENCKWHEEDTLRMNKRTNKRAQKK